MNDLPTVKCPYCNEECEADFVDIGVGYQQCGSYGCRNWLSFSLNESCKA